MVCSATFYLNKYSLSDGDDDAFRGRGGYIIPAARGVPIYTRCLPGVIELLIGEGESEDGKKNGGVYIFFSSLYIVEEIERFS